METTIEFKGENVKIYTNGKIYNGIQYVTVDGRNLSWNHNTQSWVKRPGSPAFDEAVAKAAGLVK